MFDNQTEETNANNGWQRFSTTNKNNICAFSKQYDYVRSLL